MSEQEFVYRGDLAVTPLPEMLATVHRYGVPGVMEFLRGDDTKRVYFLEGDIIFAASSDRQESLGDFLVSQGKITAAQHRVSTDELARSPGKRHGAILVQMGFLKPDELGVAVREQVQGILWSLFNWDSGAVAFKVGRFKDDEVYQIKIPTPRAILSGCKRITDGRTVTTRLGGRSTILRQLPRPDHLESLRLESAEQQLLEMVDGRRPLIDLCENGPLSPGINARVLYALVVLQLIEQESTGSGGIRIQVRGGDDTDG
jgi:hypothetical protein